MKTNSKLFDYVKNRGIKASWIAKQMGISRQAFYLKLWGDTSITMEDSLKIKTLCRMTDDEYSDLFGTSDWYNLL